MAVITQDTLGAQHEKIRIELTKEDYLPEVDKALKKHSKNASIPGFRKGMVPVGIIRKMYGQSVFADEVLSVAGKELEKHLITNKAEIFARPLPTADQMQYDFDINNPQNYSFEFEIGTRPDFTIELLNSSKATPYYKVIVSHDMLQDEIEKLQYKAGELTEPEEITSENDVLNVVFNEMNDQDEVVEGGIQKDNSFLLKYFTPALQHQLLGKKKEDSISFDLRNTFEEKVLPAILKDLGLTPTDDAAKDKRFIMTITKLGHIVPATLNKETFDKIYPNRNIETETEFKDVLTAEIQRYWDGQARTRLHNELFEQLVHETPITLPVLFLKRWMSVGGESYKAPELVEKEYGTFDHQMRWQLISDKLIKEFDLEVEQEELEQAARYHIMSYFSSQGHVPNLESVWMEPLVKKQLEDPKFREELYHKIMTDKLFYELEERVKLDEKHVSLLEFINMPSAYHHH